jgi:hypothetical protein
VLIYINKRIVTLRPSFRRDLVDHRDILIFTLGLGGDTRFFANVYSDDQHTVVTALFERQLALPKLHAMCGDFNIRHISWDPEGPDVCIHADCLMVVARACGLDISSSAEEVPTHYPFQADLRPTVIDLVFLPVEVTLFSTHSILPDKRGPYDHAPLVFDADGPDSRVPATRWSLAWGSKEEEAYLAEVSLSLQSLAPRRVDTIPELEAVVDAIATALSKAWGNHAKESRLGKHSKGWWSEECTEALGRYRFTREPDDWKSYRRVMRAAKREYFEERIHEAASTNQRPWDLMSWTRQRNLPSHEAISFGGVPCLALEDLWKALDGSYNAANDRAVDLGFLDQLQPAPERGWVPFSELELRESLSACSSHSAPGPDHVTWSYLKHWCPAPGVAGLFARIAKACVTLGHWPRHFKDSLSVIIPKPGKPSYSTPKAFRPIVLLNTLGKLVEKMLARRLQFDGVAHGAFEPMQFGGVAQWSTEDAGVYLTHLVHAGWALGRQTSVVAFDIAQFFPSLNHQVLLQIIDLLGFPAVVGNFFRSYLVGRRTTYRWDSFTSGSYTADVGVGQGSALSPVVSALYLASSNFSSAPQSPWGWISCLMSTMGPSWHRINGWRITSRP